jgi:hypothetical protein
MFIPKWYTLISRAAHLQSPPIPADRFSQVRRSLRRRIDDAVEDVFQRACLTGDLDTAEELLAVLESMRARRISMYGRNRRINDDDIVRLRTELQQRQHARSIWGIDPASAMARWA